MYARRCCSTLAAVTFARRTLIALLAASLALQPLAAMAGSCGSASGADTAAHPDATAPAHAGHANHGDEPGAGEPGDAPGGCACCDAGGCAVTHCTGIAALATAGGELSPDRSRRPPGVAGSIVGQSPQPPLRPPIS